MKKRISVLLSCICILGTACGVAEAAEGTDIQLDGTYVVHYRDQHDQNPGDRTRTGYKETLTLNATIPVQEKLSLYARFTYQTLQNNYGIFSADYVNSKKQNNAALDAMGITYKNAAYSYKLGLQALTFGGGAIYDNTYIGHHSLPYAVKISGKVGRVESTFIGAKTNYQTGIENDTFYVLQGSYAIDKKTSVGAMLANVSYGKDTASRYFLPNRNVCYLSLYGSKNLTDKISLSTEIVRSNSSENNTAIQATIKKKLDAKNTISAGYYRIENDAVVVDYNAAEMSTYPNSNAQGYTVAWTHTFNQNISMKIGEYSYKKINAASSSGAATDRSRFTATVTAKF